MAWEWSGLRGVREARRSCVGEDISLERIGIRRNHNRVLVWRSILQHRAVVDVDTLEGSKRSARVLAMATRCSEEGEAANNSQSAKRRSMLPRPRLVRDCSFLTQTYCPLGPRSQNDAITSSSSFT